MLLRLFLGGALAAAASAQTSAPQVELANLREDVRGLTQRVGELALRVEQLERENSELKAKAGSAHKAYATVAQLNEAIAELNTKLQLAIATAKTDTLQQVATQIKELAKQTNAALDSLAKVQATRPAVQAPVATNEEAPKDATRYTVQKGDSLASIAKKTGAKQQDIIAVNKLADPSHITVGQTLLIPNSGGK